MDSGRAGLILGGNTSVWDEAARAMERCTYDSVIAFRAAAERWPGRIDAIAENLPHAHCLARMLGVDQPVVCGA